MPEFEVHQVVKFKYDPDLDPPIENAGGPYGPWKKGYPLYGVVTGFGSSGGVMLTTREGALSASSTEELGDFGLAPPGIEIELFNVVGPPSLVHVAPERLMDWDELEPAMARRCTECGFVESTPKDMPFTKPFECPNGCESEGEVIEDV